MRRYVIKRILLIIPTLLLVTFFVFCIVRLIPGDVVEMMVAEQGYGDDEEELREMLGLDKPLITQYLVYMKSIFKGDWGISLWTGLPVMDEIKKRLPISFSLALM